MINKKQFYVTTPIYYVNDVPHIGHMYTDIAADILSRFKILEGYETLFLTGTDEHGQKIEKSAKNKNEDTKVFVDKISKTFQNLTSLLNLSNKDFIRTTEERHKKAVISIWETLLTKGYIYLGKYSGWYAIKDEAYYTEDETKINENGVRVAVSSNAEVEWKEEESYFFKLSGFTEKLLNYYDNNPDFVAPRGRFNEVKSFVKKGLKDLSISRSNFSWGIPVPNNPNHVIYVWMDALISYISPLGYPDTKTEKYQNLWQNNNSLHIIGKDILIFHAVYWPAFLLAADLPLPSRIFAHGWWLNEGQKISKSLGNVIVPADIIEKYSLDAVRYFLFKEVSFGNDGDFSDAAITNRINNELANEYGNLVQRTLSIINKNYSGELCNVPSFSEDQMKYIMHTQNIFTKCKAYIDDQAISHYITEAWDIIKYANAYIDKTAPWALIKNGKLEEASNILLFLVELIKRCSILLHPVMPSSTTNILQQINYNDISTKGFSSIIETNHKVNLQNIVFKKIFSE